MSKSSAPTHEASRPRGWRSLRGAFAEALFLFAVGALAGAVPVGARADTTLVLQPTKDSFLRTGRRNQNEGGHPTLRVRRRGLNRAVIGFDDEAIAEFVSNHAFSSATLALTIAEIGSGWGAGRPVAVHPLIREFAEGNGRWAGFAAGDRSRGSGSGVTWNCAIDENIANSRRDCVDSWGGGGEHPASPSVAVHVNGMEMGDEIRWDVTNDVLGSVTAWLVKKVDERTYGGVQYFSKEGSVEEGNLEFAPRLILVADTHELECALHGFSFGPYVEGQSPDRGSVVSREQLRERLGIIHGSATWVRTFGSTMGLEATGEIAHELGYSTAIGAWLDSNRTTNEREIENLIGAAQAGHVDLAIVGSEVLLRGDLTVEELIGYVERVRAAIPSDIRVTTADLYTKWKENPDLIAAVDVVLANFYPFWDGAPIDSAMATLDGSYLHLLGVVGGKPIVVSETGWPSAGDPFGEAVPSSENAAFYLKNFISWAESKDVEHFYFEALDEPWKRAAEGEVGAHWGVFDKDGILKPGMIDTFECERTEDNWTGRSIRPGPNPAIEFRFVPEIGSHENLTGRVADVDPWEHAVAVYIRVRGRWWTKPTFANPKTTIRADGGWITDITTGGIDSSATEIAAFLIPIDYAPPALGGQSSIPEELSDVAVAEDSIGRE